MDYKFITPVSMESTQQQLSKMLTESDLKDMGYVEGSTSFEKGLHEFLWTNGNNYLGYLHVGSKRGVHNNDRHYIDHYNPELFLALAAMTDHKDGIKGEYLKCVKTPVSKLGEVYKRGDFIKITSMNMGCKDFGGFNSEYDRRYFTKATKEELINHFTNKKTVENTYMTTRTEMEGLHAIACNSWKNKIVDLVKKYSRNVFEEEVVLPIEIVDGMYSASSKKQIKVLNGMFKDQREAFKPKTIELKNQMFDDGLDIKKYGARLKDGGIHVSDSVYMGGTGYRLGEGLNWEIIERHGYTYLIPTYK